MSWQTCKDYAFTYRWAIIVSIIFASTPLAILWIVVTVLLAGYDNNIWTMIVWIPIFYLLFVLITSKLLWEDGRCRCYRYKIEALTFEGQLAAIKFCERKSIPARDYRFAFDEAAMYFVRADHWMLVKLGL